MPIPMPPSSVSMKDPTSTPKAGRKKGKGGKPAVKLKSKVSVSIKGGKSEDIAKMLPNALRGFHHATKGSILER